MIETLKQEVLQRIADGTHHFAKICSLRDSRSTLRGKGLSFVEMYAVHEFAVTNAVRVGLQAISGHALKVHRLNPGMLAIAADDRLKSVQDSPLRSQWSARKTLFEWLSAATTADMNLLVFPNDGSHFKLQQLQTIWQLFGLHGRAVPDKRLLQLVDEIVENRNSVAHGRERPEEIGKRYTNNDIRRKYHQIGRVAVHVLARIGQQCSESHRISS